MTRPGVGRGERAAAEAEAEAKAKAEVLRCVRNDKFFGGAKENRKQQKQQQEQKWGFSLRSGLAPRNAAKDGDPAESYCKVSQLRRVCS
jgi:hypothetical protein